MDKRMRRICTLTLMAGFLLGIRNDRLALWRDGEARPLQIYDIRVSSLPPADQLQLRRGIRIESREDLWLLLENYLE